MPNHKGRQEHTQSFTRPVMSTFPNPDTYLNHLSPAQAAQFEVVRNISLATMGVRTIVYFEKPSTL
jgi:hypothetical protein